MKNLAKILGVSLLGALSFNSNAQNKTFVKEDYHKYCMTYALADLNEDSIYDVVVVDYDLNNNSKRDVRGLYLITGKEKLDNKDILYRTKSNACMIILDSDEDGKDDELLIDKDLNGDLDSYRNLNDIKKPKPLIL